VTLVISIQVTIPLPMGGKGGGPVAQGPGSAKRGRTPEGRQPGKKGGNRQTKKREWGGLKDPQKKNWVNGGLMAGLTNHTGCRGWTNGAKSGEGCQRGGPSCFRLLYQRGGQMFVTKGRLHPKGRPITAAWRAENRLLLLLRKGRTACHPGEKVRPRKERPGQRYLYLD